MTNLRIDMDQMPDGNTMVLVYRGDRLDYWVIVTRKESRTSEDVYKLIENGLNALASGE